MTHEQAHELTLLTRKLRKALNNGAPFNQVMSLIQELSTAILAAEPEKGSKEYWQ